MVNNKIIGIIVLIAIIAIGALAATNFMKQGQQVAAAGDKNTKVSFYNNGTTWTSIDFILENMTLKNGDIQTIYTEEYIKPNGTATLDLSNLAGYNNKPLPAGTTITFLAWFGLNNAPGDLNVTMQGWSGSFQPPAGNPTVNIFNKSLPDDGQLPSNLTDSAVFTDTDLTALAQKVGFNDATNSSEPLFVQGIITVNQDGTVTITLLQTPTLCNLAAHII